jgi:ribosomal protein S18 acetylase RimI-like enzyme
LWPPQTLNLVGSDQIEDRLIQSALDWLRLRGAKLAQAILTPAEDAHAGSLPRNGLHHVTQLHYLRHALREIPQALPPEGVAFETFNTDRPQAFYQALNRSYDGTLDFPELDGVREVQEVVEGHMNQGRFHPDRWRLTRRGGRPIAVLLVNDLPEWHAREIAYVGVVPQARRCGLGRALVAKALAEAKEAGLASLILAVDRRNAPARRLYQELGFERFDHREVYLRVYAVAR